MPRVGFEHTVPVFERVKTINVLGRAATVIGLDNTVRLKFIKIRWLKIVVKDCNLVTMPCVLRETGKLSQICYL
jgi:hypothetical protein